MRPQPIIALVRTVQARLTLRHPGEKRQIPIYDGAASSPPCGVCLATERDSMRPISFEVELPTPFSHLTSRWEENKRSHRHRRAPNRPRGDDPIDIASVRATIPSGAHPM